MPGDEGRKLIDYGVTILVLTFVVGITISLVVLVLGAGNQQLDLIHTTAVEEKEGQYDGVYTTAGLQLLVTKDVELFLSSTRLTLATARTLDRKTTWRVTWVPARNRLEVTTVT